jgi:hypothetical protein
MALVNLTKPLTDGTTAYGSDVITDLNLIVNDYNGNIQNVNLAANAAIVDSKLAQITSASKVSGTAFTGLASIPAGAGVIPTANLPTIGVLADGSVSPSNKLNNGNFKVWSLGTALAPDSWTLAGTSATVAQGTGSTDVLLGTYSAGITRVGNDCTLSQDISTSYGIAYWKGRSVTFSCWVYATAASRAYIQIYDGIGTTASSPHAGDSAWHLISVTRTINASATSVTLQCAVKNGNTTAYFDGAMGVDGTAIWAFNPSLLDFSMGSKISKVTLSSASSSILCTTLSAGNRYRLYLNLVQNTSIGYIQLQFGNVGGIDTGSNYKSYAVGTYPLSNTGVAYIQLVGNDYVAVSGTYWGTFDISTEAPTNGAQLVGNQGCAGNAALDVATIWGYYAGSSPVTQLQILTSAGTMTGYATLYQLT